jgi:asparagine synthase (glutamine-hydrolysing)
MSAIAGILNLDGSPIEHAWLDRMAGRMRLRGYEPVTHGADACGVVCGRQENLAADSTAIVAFDGRVDNRDELIASLGAPGNLGDAAIVLAAFRAWGSSFASRLDGDYAIGVIDLRERQVTCVRDRFGVRCLFYRIAPGWIAFASSIDVLVAAVAPMPAVNEGMIGEYLSSFIVSTRDTPFENVFRVAPAHYMRGGSSAHTQSEYWSPSAQPLQRRRDDELEDETRALLRDAVRRRLRGRTVGIMLSGGLDSSAVTSLAAELVRDRAVATERVETFTGSVPGPDDERAFAAAMNERWQLAGHVITEQRPRPGQFMEEIALDCEPQMFPHSATMDVMRTVARDRGVRVMLTGHGGDDWFGSGTAAYTDLLAGGRLLTLFDRVRRDAREDFFYGWPYTIRLTLWPLVPPFIQHAVRALFRRGRAPRWIDPGFAARIALADRLAAFRSRRRFATRELADNWFQAVHGIHVHAAEVVTRGGDRFGLELAHPFFDRRVAEFGLTLPGDQLWRQGRQKHLLRQSMRPYLPDLVATRRTNPAADHAYLHAIEAESGDQPFAHLQCETNGWINGPVVRKMWSSLRAAPERAAHHGKILWGIQAIDLWLRARTMVKY